MKELRNKLSEYLRRVAGGERVTVTMHGRPVAEILPAGSPRDPDDEIWRRLAAEGKVTLPTLPKSDRDPPLYKAPRSASELIIREREQERRSYR